MSVLGVALLFVRVLPGELAIAFARFFVIAYLLLHPAYRREIANNLELLCSRRDNFFWVRNGWSVGRNLALMASLGTRRCDELIDRAEVRCDNSTLRVLEQELHIGMFSCHFGLWELLPPVFARAGYIVGVLTGEQGDRVLAAITRRLRSGQNIKLLRSSADILYHSRNCRILGFLIDNTRRGGQRSIRVGELSFRVPQFGFRVVKRSHRVMVPVWAYLEKGRLRVGVGRAGEPAEVLAQLLEQVRRRPQDWVFWAKDGALGRAA